MKISIKSITFFFLLLLLYIPSSNLLGIGNEIKGLSIKINEDHFKMLYQMYIAGEPFYKSAKIKEPKIKDIQKSLQNNFADMVNSYKANKSNLPKCVQDAFNTFLNEIKTPDKNGKPKVTIEWKIYDDRPGRSVFDRSQYNKDYDDFYFQDVNNSKITVNGLDFTINSNCGGRVYDDIQEGYRTWRKNTSFVNIYGAFKDKCQAHGGKKPKNLLTNSRIPGTLFCPVQAIKWLRKDRLIKMCFRFEHECQQYCSIIRHGLLV